ncbi:hypothetical protein CVT24_011783, partial [Panaeolus cyanescens]
EVDFSRGFLFNRASTNREAKKPERIVASSSSKLPTSQSSTGRKTKAAQRAGTLPLLDETALRKDLRRQTTAPGAFQASDEEEDEVLRSQLSGSSPLSTPPVTPPRQKPVTLVPPGAPEKQKSRIDSNIESAPSIAILRKQLNMPPPPGNGGNAVENRDPLVTLESEEEEFPHASMPDWNKKSRIEFNPEQPESLVGYLKLLEMSFAKAGVKKDRMKKGSVVLYLGHPQTASLWESIAEYRAGTYEEFKKALYALYPEAEHLAKGSYLGYKDIVTRTRNLQLHESGKVGRFALQVTNEVQKLRTSGPKDANVITDREIVTDILGCLSPEFATVVKARMSLQHATKGADGKALAVADVTPLTHWASHTDVLNVMCSLTRESDTGDTTTVPKSATEAIAAAAQASKVSHVPTASSPVNVKHEYEELTQFKTSIESMLTSKLDKLQTLLEARFAEEDKRVQKTELEVKNLRQSFEVLTRQPPYRAGRPFANSGTQF